MRAIEGSQKSAITEHRSMTDSGSMMSILQQETRSVEEIVSGVRTIVHAMLLAKSLDSCMPIEAKEWRPTAAGGRVSAVARQPEQKTSVFPFECQRPESPTKRFYVVHTTCLLSTTFCSARLQELFGVNVSRQRTVSISEYGLGFKSSDNVRNTVWSFPLPALPVGIGGAPQVFQSRMHAAIDGLQGVFCKADNINNWFVTVMLYYFRHTVSSRPL